jgi:hypothetical protein
MAQSTKKQFGVWMDSQHATIVGNVNEDEFTVLGHASNPGAAPNTNENTQNNEERTVLAKFFKEILTHMQNAEEVHLTGTGTAQEQFIKYMANSPQFKNTVTHESTANKMSDERLVEYIKAKFN